MAREFAGNFYKTAKWVKCRKAIMERDKSLCVKCAERGVDTPATLVHHIIPLDETNINDPDIALGEDNLISVCDECHARLHNRTALRDNLMFDENGMLVER